MEPSPLPSPLPDVVPSVPVSCWAEQCGKCTDHVSQCESHLAELSAAILQPIIAQLEEQEAYLAQLSGMILGSFERELASHEAFIAKLSDKISSKLFTLMQEAYAWGMACGIPLPEPEEIIGVNQGWMHPLACLPQAMPEQAPSQYTPIPTADQTIAVGLGNPGVLPPMQSYPMSETGMPGGTAVPAEGPLAIPFPVPPETFIPSVPSNDTEATKESVVPIPQGEQNQIPTQDGGSKEAKAGTVQTWNGCGDASQTLGLLAAILKSVINPPACKEEEYTVIKPEDVGILVAGPNPGDAYNTELRQDTSKCGDGAIFGKDEEIWYAWRSKDKDGNPILAVSDHPSNLPFNTSTGQAILQHKTLREIFSYAYGSFAYVMVYCDGKHPTQKESAPVAPPAKPTSPTLQNLSDLGKLWDGLKLPNWGDANVCGDIGRIVEAMNSFSSGGYAQLFGLKDKDGRDSTPDWIKSVTGQDSLGIGAAIAAYLRFFANVDDAVLKTVANMLPCGGNGVIIPLLIKGVIGAVEHWAGADLEVIGKQLAYWINSACQSELPGSGEADEMFLAEQINKDQWNCLVRANGEFTSWREKILAAKRSRLSPEDAWRLWARGELSEQMARDYLRQDGYTEQSEAQAQWELQKEKPSISEIIRFMVKNVGDRTLVERLRMDEEFDKKFNSDMEKWALEHGMTKDIALYHWRAHWLEPAPSQLYTMLQRLRPGRVPKELVVDEELARYGLGANDWSPFWRDRLIAVSYRPMTRVDARRAYNSGTIDEKELGEIYQDQGYSAKTAGQLVDFTRKQKETSAGNNRWLKLYARGGIRRAEAVEGALREGVSQTAIDSALAYIDASNEAAAVRACQKGIKAQFLSGGIDYGDAVRDLNTLPMDVGQRNAMASQWKCEKEAKGKVAPAATLCKWFKAGLLAQDEYVARLRRLGWSEADANRLAAVCGADVPVDEVNPPALPAGPPKRKRGAPALPGAPANPAPTAPPTAGQGGQPG